MSDCRDKQYTDIKESLSFILDTIRTLKDSGIFVPVLGYNEGAVNLILGKLENLQMSYEAEIHHLEYEIEIKNQNIEGKRDYIKKCYKLLEFRQNRIDALELFIQGSNSRVKRKVQVKRK